MYELAGLKPEFVAADIPPKQDTLRFYLDRALEKERIPESFSHLGPGSLRFEKLNVRPSNSPPTPAVSYVRFVALLDELGRDLLICDMRHGLVMVQRPYLKEKPLGVIAKIPNPARAEVVDLDRDGQRDLLVANLGSLVPSDHDRGSVVWLRSDGKSSYETIVLLEKVGRVADVQAADLDADGDLDLVVAVFGWRTTGEVLLLENLGPDEKEAGGRPRFALADVLDPRNGAINVPIVDIDGDGRPDIVVLLAQQHETLLVLLNRGELEFEAREIYRAPHPDWGSSGIEIADLDGDGDADILMVNGDLLDNSVLKTYHRVAWFENLGEANFTEHELGAFPGAHKTRAVDMDLDGDLDVVATSFLPQFPMETRKLLKLESIIWFEQTSTRKFERHSIETYLCDHPTLDAVDFDGDGDVDLCVGNFALEPKKLWELPHWFTYFENLTRP